jgi:hypothetical protein
MTKYQESDSSWSNGSRWVGSTHELEYQEYTWYSKSTRKTHTAGSRKRDPSFQSALP